MTLGGLAIAIGELVDDAVVDVENILRRLKENRVLRATAPGARGHRRGEPGGPLRHRLRHDHHRARLRAAVRAARHRGAAVRAARHRLHRLDPRVAGRFDHRHARSSPTTCLSGPARGHEGDSFVVRQLKRANRALLNWAFDRPLAGARHSRDSRSWLPAWPRRCCRAHSCRRSTKARCPAQLAVQSRHFAGRVASARLRSPNGWSLTVPEVKSVGRRTGRAELDEHAEGVHFQRARRRPHAFEPLQGRKSTRIFASSSRSCRLSVAIGQPISHRLDHMQSGVRAQVRAQDFRRGPRHTCAVSPRPRASSLRRVPGLVDLQVEKQVLIPQLRIQIDYGRAALYGLTPAAVTQALEALSNGRRVSQIVDGNRRFDVVDATLRPGSLDHRPARSADRDAGRLHSAGDVRRSDGNRWPEPNPARGNSASHCGVRQRRRAARHGRDRDRHPPHPRRSQAPAGLPDEPRGRLPGAGRGDMADRRTLAGVARR